jgi:anti-sigma-K factor RskA
MDERTEELAGLYVMGVLTPAERQAFEIAMARNPGLVALVAGFRTVRDAMAGAVPPVTPPPVLKQRIMAQLDVRAARKKKKLPPAVSPVFAWPGSSPAAESSVPPEATPKVTSEPMPEGTSESQAEEFEPAEATYVPPEYTEPAQVPYAPARARSDGPGFLSFWFPWAVTAAVVVWGINLYFDREELKDRVFPLTARVNRLNHLANVLCSQTNTLQQTVAGLSDLTGRVDDLHIVLLGPPGNDLPKALGVSLWDNQAQTGVFLAQNLRPPPPGEQFQLWMMDSLYPTPVNAGVFSMDDSGAAHVHFKPDRPIASVTKFIVTMEPAGGSATPTFKDLVLLGQ